MSNPGQALSLKRALIISPSRPFTQTHLACLRHCGLEEFATSSSGVEAAKLLHKTHFDLILCEDRLNDMDCLDFMRLVKLHPALALIPSILVSSTGRDDIVHLAWETGFSGYLVKPYSLKAMERQVARAAKSEIRSTSSDSSVEIFLKTLEQLMLLTGYGDDKAHTRKGLCLLKQGQYAQAKEAFLKAESKGRLSPEAQLGLAKAHQGLMDLKAARRCLQEALQSFEARERLLDAADQFPSLKMSPAKSEDAGLTAQLARASYFCGSAKQAKERLESGRQSLKSLQRRVVGEPGELDEFEMPQPRTAGDLRLYLSIIGHTIKAYLKNPNAPRRVQ